MEEDARPAWSHKTPERVARWLLTHRVLKIEYATKMKSEDSWDELLVLRDDGNAKIEVAPSLVSREWAAEIFFRVQGGLIGVNDSLRKSIEAIDVWEKRNARDRAEFARLSRKFRSTHPATGDE